MRVPARHFVLETSLEGPYPEGLQLAHVAMGCFWGAEKLYWQLPGVHSTSVGYLAGQTLHPNYQEVCSGNTGHTEAVRIVFDPEVLSFESLLRIFWEGHNPTQGMRQGNDRGTCLTGWLQCQNNSFLETLSALFAICLCGRVNPRVLIEPLVLQSGAIQHS
jgi:methionine-S-sulfoxide reductase